MFVSRAEIILVFFAALLAASNSSADDALPEGITLVRELRYREGDSNVWRLDLAMPSEKTDEPRPAIVIIHGGGWLEGDKSSFSTVKNRPPGNIIDFAKLGFVAVTINYRLSKEAPFPAGLHDCKCAVRWLRAHAGDYHVDPNRIGAWGNSAGGHLALMLAMTAAQADLEGDGPWREFSSQVQAAASDSGPIDLVGQYEQGTLRTVVSLFMNGAPEGDRLAAYHRASPTSHIHKQVPSLLLIYGVDDNQVPVELTDKFVTALDQAGLKDVSYHRLAKVKHCPHSLIRVPWVVPIVDEFFLRTLGKSPN